MAYGAVFHGKNAKNNKKRRYEDLSDSDTDGGHKVVNSIYNQRRAERMQNDQMLLNNEDGKHIDLKAEMEERENE